MIKGGFCKLAFTFSVKFLGTYIFCHLLYFFKVLALKSDRAYFIIFGISLGFEIGGFLYPLGVSYVV